MTETHIPRPITDAERRMWETTGDGVVPDLVQPPQAWESAPSDPTAAPPSPPATRDPNRPAVLDHMVPSGLRQRYVIEMADGTMYDVETGPADVLRWEKTFKRGWFDNEGVSFARLVFISWAALKRTGVEVPNYPQFEVGIADVHFEMNEDSTEPDPTQGDPGDFS